MNNEKMKKLLLLAMVIGLLMFFSCFGESVCHAQSPEWIQIKKIALSGQSNDGIRFGKDFKLYVVNKWETTKDKYIQVQYWCRYSGVEKEVYAMCLVPGICYVTSYSEKTRTFRGGYGKADGTMSNHPISWSEGIESGKVFMKDLRDHDLGK